MARYCVMACFLFAVGAIAAGMPAEVPDLRVIHYTLDLKPDIAAGSISGTVSIELSHPAAAPVRLSLIESLRMQNVLLDGRPSSFSRRAGAVEIPVAAGSHVLSLSYAGEPGSMHFRFDATSEGLYAASYGMPGSAAQWWPTLEDPSLKASSVDISVTVPSGLVVASNGTLVETTALAGGKMRYHWHERYPIYADVISIAIGPYVEVKDSYASVTGQALSLHYFLFKEDAGRLRNVMAPVPTMLRAYESHFGPYPFQGEQYGFAEMKIPSFREHQTLPSVGQGLLLGTHQVWDLGDVPNVIAHDMAHQWFGNSLTPRSWSDIWLNEGFSNYAVALWHEQLGGPAAYRAFMRSLDTHDFSGSVYIRDSTDLRAMFDTTTFNKGAWVLHMLRHVMGDRVFFQALRTYVGAHRYGIVDTADWIAACEKQYGHTLNWFFTEWVYGQGEPSLKTSWRDTGRGLQLEISQSQSGTAFVMPVDVEVRSDAGTVRQTVWLHERTQIMTLLVRGKVQSVVLDPDGWLLQEAIPASKAAT